MPLTFEQVRALVTRIDRDRRPTPRLEAEDVAHLRTLARDPDIGIARKAVALAASVPGPESLEILTEASTSPHEEIRLTAAATLWRYGPSADDLAPALLLDPDQGICRFALRSQARRVRAHADTPLPERTRDAIDLVAARAAPALRLLAASVVARLEGEEPTSAEVSGLLESPLLSRDVADVIGPQGSGPLLALIRSADAPLAGDATDVASEIEGDPTALLTAAAEHPAASVRIRAGQALARTGPLGLLLLLLDDEEADVRHQALAAVPRFPASRELSAKLAQLIARDPVETVRARAQRSTPPQTENGSSARDHNPHQNGQ